MDFDPLWRGKSGQGQAPSIQPTGADCHGQEGADCTHCRPHTCGSPDPASQLETLPSPCIFIPVPLAAPGPRNPDSPLAWWPCSPTSPDRSCSKGTQAGLRPGACSVQPTLLAAEAQGRPHWWCAVNRVWGKTQTCHICSPAAQALESLLPPPPPPCHFLRPPFGLAQPPGWPTSTAKAHREPGTGPE